MKDETRSAIRLLEALTERAKELTCLYAIEEALKEPHAEIDQVCEAVIRAIPPGWQYPEICRAEIILEGKEYPSHELRTTPWKLSADVVQQDHVVGTISVFYTEEMPSADHGPFLIEEKKLIETIADRLSHFLTYKKMTNVLGEWQAAGRDISESRRGDWEAVLDLIRQTDKVLFLRISNKMLNHLCWSGIEEAEGLRREHMARGRDAGNHHGDETSQPVIGRLLDFSTEFTEEIFRIAADHLSDAEILSRIQMWIQEDKLSALLQTAHRHLPLSEVSNALRRYFFAAHDETDDRYPIARGLKVLLIGRILSDRLEYINVAKNYIDISDLYHLLQKVAFSPESQGKLGGKCAGLFLASQILEKSKKGSGAGPTVRIPKTWCIPSDMMLHFLRHNNIEEIIEQKYKEIERVRLEYPHVVGILKQSVFPPEMVSGLSAALDDFGDSPLVVRSSSLLEDRTASAFVGKYKSVFLGNQGTKEERLNDLMQAVAEVYAANFSPDPIEYRAECGLLEFSEQMGVMIQEVVGTRVGPYFLSVYSGVARSRNDFRGSPEIKANDGVVRIVPGLGTRAADRTGDERPALILPGRPSVQVVRSADNTSRHAPKRIDVINLDTNAMETVELARVWKNLGNAYPDVEQIVSVYEDGKLRPAEKGSLDFERDQLVVTFDGLTTRSPFALQVRHLLQTLEESMGIPVEIEFASDGEHLYLLQCRHQTIARTPRPVPIPKEIPEDKVVFSANRYISNGRVSNLTHLVYLDPAGYEALQDPSGYEAVEQAVKSLNYLLPKRQFMVMRPGWTARDEGREYTGIKYSDVTNAAFLIELVKADAESGGGPSFGTYFLQDLVESNIPYLPVFPDDAGVRFNRHFLMRAPNLLREMLPESAALADVLRVIDVPKATNGNVMQVLMNAELNEAVGVLAEPEGETGPAEEEELMEAGHPENYWRWRYRMAEQVASQLDSERFGVTGFYVFGSTKNGTAGPASDIDVLVHFRGTEAQREDLRLWLEGWSLCLDEVNYLRTGYRSGGLLDAHLVTDDDIAERTSYAVKIDAVTDAARPLKLKGTEDREDPDGTAGRTVREGAA
jgi:hypothetical protein